MINYVLRFEKNLFSHVFSFNLNIIIVPHSGYLKVILKYISVLFKSLVLCCEKRGKEQKHFVKLLAFCSSRLTKDLKQV